MFSVICLYLVCIKSSACFLGFPLGGFSRRVAAKGNLGGLLSTKLTDEGRLHYRQLNYRIEYKCPAPHIILKPQCSFIYTSKISNETGIRISSQIFIYLPHFLRFFKKEIKILRKFRFLGICLPSENLRKDFLCVIIFLVEHPGTADAISALRSRKNIVP